MEFRAHALHPAYEFDFRREMRWLRYPKAMKKLLERPLYGHLATTRPDGTAQVSPMWFHWDGEVLRFTHTTKRQKYRNVTAHPQVAMSVIDPDNPYRYLEVRGAVEAIVPDPEGDFYMQYLNARYGGPSTQPPPDHPDRVVIVVRPTGYNDMSVNRR